MNTIIEKGDVPRHLLSIPELDFSDDLFVEGLGGIWFRLGSSTITSRRDERGVEDVVERQTILLKPKCFSNIFDELESIGNVLHGIGKPQGGIFNTGKREEYRFTPFYRFEFSFTKTVGEPLVFVRSDNSRLFIDPDIWMFFELEEKTSGIWWDPKRGVEVLRHQIIDQDNLEIVEIRSEYLRKYLQARQMSLIIAHYRHFHLFNPSQKTISKFVQEDVTLGSPEKGVKAIFQNSESQQGILPEPFLLRRLHLWFEIKPAKINIDDPWTEQPSFDIYAFTLPTSVGQVAPGRWANFLTVKGRKFEGEVCNFMDHIYFRQEVLTKYEGASNFEVADDGSVSCSSYWGINRSTRRIGNELLATAIGDFAEGVPFEEWLHWKQYAVEPPSPETAKALIQEQTIPDAVNFMMNSFLELNIAFANMATSIGKTISEPLWGGSLDSLAGRQMKWVYPATAHDDEFLKRATLVSTLLIDGLTPELMRKLLVVFGENLHMDFNDPPKTLGSRNLLQRLTFITMLIEKLNPDITEIPELIRKAESEGFNKDETGLNEEILRLYKHIKDEFAPIAFLYDLRIHGGVAHKPNKAKAAIAATQLGLPNENWHRTHYLALLKLVAGSINKISQHFMMV